MAKSHRVCVGKRDYRSSVSVWGCANSDEFASLDLKALNLQRTALIFCDLKNDFLHP